MSPRIYLLYEMEDHRTHIHDRFAGKRLCHLKPEPINPSETSAKLQSRSLSDPHLKSFIEKNLNDRLSVWPPRAWNFDMLTLAALYFNPNLDLSRAQYGAAAQYSPHTREEF